LVKTVSTDCQPKESEENGDSLPCYLLDNLVHLILIESSVAFALKIHFLCKLIDSKQKFLQRKAGEKSMRCRSSMVLHAIPIDEESS